MPSHIHDHLHVVFIIFGLGESNCLRCCNINPLGSLHLSSVCILTRFFFTLLHLQPSTMAIPYSCTTHHFPALGSFALVTSVTFWTLFQFLSFLSLLLSLSFLLFCVLVFTPVNHCLLPSSVSSVLCLFAFSDFFLCSCLNCLTDYVTYCGARCVAHPLSCFAHKSLLLGHCVAWLCYTHCLSFSLDLSTTASSDSPHT